MARARSAAAASAGLAALLLAGAFAAAGGNQLGRMALVEVVILLGAGLALGLWAMHPRSAVPHGVGSVVCFGVFAVVTALSAAWSIDPDRTVQETGRALAYVAVFAVAVAGAQLLPRAAGVVGAAVLTAAVGVCGWALVSRIFPAGLAEQELAARLGGPFDYWNALGAMAALGVPAALWLGSRRDRPVALTALAYPALGVLGLTILLTQSRAALGVALLVAGLWLAMVPLRLRTAAVLGLSVIGVAPVAAWALSKAPFTEILQPLSARESVAGDFGLMVLAMCVLLFAAGFAVELLSRRRQLAVRRRRQLGGVLVGALCVAALAGVVAVAVSDRGLTGTLSDRVEELTGENAVTPEGAARLRSVSSARSQYWRQAGEVFEEQPLVGRGANSFGVARLAYRDVGGESAYAHGFLPQTLADLGLLGLLAVLAVLTAWLAAAARSTGLRPGRRRRPPWTDERAVLVALALSAGAYGVHSAVDWTWFVPGPTLAALVAAGFVAGRGPLAPIGAPPAARASAVARGRLGGLLPAGRPEPLRAAAAAGLALTALLCAWAAWQPERAARTTERAYELVEEGDLRGASEEVLRARDMAPYSPEPLYAKAAVLTAGDRPKLAYQTLEQAVLDHPRDPEPWIRLATFELDVLDLPQRAMGTLEGVRRVDPFSRQLPVLFGRARAELAAPPPAEG